MRCYSEHYRKVTAPAIFITRRACAALNCETKHCEFYDQVVKHKAK